MRGIQNSKYDSLGEGLEMAIELIRKRGTLFFS